MDTPDHIISLDKKQERELEYHKHALNLAAGVIMLDKDFRVIDVNNHFCQILGRNRTEFIGKHNIQSKFSGIAENELNLKQKTECLSQGNRWQGESCFLNNRDEQIWFTETTTPFLDEHKTPYQYLSILIDITDKKRFDAQLLQQGNNLQDLVDEQIKDIRLARDAAENANKAKSEFLANMSHELRTPMHAIISFTYLSLKQIQTIPLTQTQTDKLHRFLSNIESSSQRLLLLLNDLLDLSKLESGTDKFYFKNNDLYQLSQKISEVFSAEIKEKQLDLILQKPSTPTLAWCDKNKILQVLNNLIANAIKFSPENKKILISIENTEVILGNRATDTKKTNGLLLSLTDQGSGIPDDELTSVFDKFIQSSKTKSGAGGTGLGLSICQEIVLAHKGKIWAEHNPEGGAIFKLFLPNAQLIGNRQS